MVSWIWKEEQMKQQNPTITQDLYEYLTIYLNGADSRSLEPILHLAESIEIKLRASGTQLFYVQNPGDYDIMLEYPKVWVYAKWKESVELWNRQKAWSEQQRQLRYILEENVKRTMWKLMNLEWVLLDERRAMTAAYHLVKANKTGALKLLGVTIATTMEEI